jgi:hypothetical protein
MCAPCRLSVQKPEEIFCRLTSSCRTWGVPLYGPISTDASRRLATVDQTKIRPRIAWAVRVHPCVIFRSCGPLFQASTRKNITWVYEKRVLAQLRRVQRRARGRSQTVAVRRKGRSSCSIATHGVTSHHDSRRAARQRHVRVVPRLAPYVMFASVVDALACRCGRQP